MQPRLHPPLWRRNRRRYPRTSPREPSPPLAAAEPAKQAAPRITQEERPEVYVVRPGDTLWDIAERFFGGGWHYKRIHRENRKQIRHPS